MKIDKKVLTKEKQVSYRPSAPLVKKSGKARPVRVQLGISGAEFGTHVFPPGESWPRTVAVQSAHNSSTNFAAAGSRMVNLIIQARNDHP